jgi:hypothetical protein
LESIDFLVIGHVCQDVTPEGHVLGGTAAYAAITARNLGAHAGLLTRVSAGIGGWDPLDGITVLALPSETTTTFVNTYRGGRRTQYLRSVADPICVHDIPAEWRDPKIVLLGPLAQELDMGLTRAFPDSLLGVTPQGWMRRWDADGQVHNDPGLWRFDEVEDVQAVILSEEDILGERAFLERLIARFPIVALTEGRRGSTVYHRGRAFHIEPRPAHQVDPTGAGDVFAAAFLIRLRETRDPLESAYFANIVASFSVEGPAQQTIPTRRRAQEWMQEHPGHHSGATHDLAH